MTCDQCGRQTPRAGLCRDCDRETRQEDRVSYDYGWTENDDNDTEDTNHE